MPKGIYRRKRKAEEEEGKEDAEDKVEDKPKEEDEDADEKDEEADSSEDKKPKKRKKRKALFTREKPHRKDAAVKRAADRAARLKKEKEAPEEEEEEAQDKEEEEEKSPEKEEDLVLPNPSLDQLEAFTPLQLLLDNLLRSFVRKDPEEYFVFPVTEDVAPDYSEFVSEQMNFYAMRQKVDRNEYADLEAFRRDLQLILSNCYAYNKPNTVYFAAGKKMEQMVRQYLSREHLLSLAATLPFLREVPPEQLGFPLPDSRPKEPAPSANSELRARSAVVADDMGPAEILVQARAAAKAAATKLAARRPNAKLGFLNQKEDGTTYLNVITPESIKRPSSPGGTRKVRLVDLCPPPKEGNPGLAPWTESPEKVLAPVHFLNYGPYASFAPQTDSTWASLSAEESARALRTYGDLDSAEYAWSLRNFVSEAGEELTGMVDSLLDTLTQGEHSKLHGKLPPSERPPPPPVEPVDVGALRSLSQLGLDVSWLDRLSGELRKELGLKAAAGPGEERGWDGAETAAMLGDLEWEQGRRLGKAPPLCVKEAEGPTRREARVAAAVVEALGRGVAAAAPSDVVGEAEVRACLGIADDVDMDLFNEFLIPNA